MRTIYLEVVIEASQMGRLVHSIDSLHNLQFEQITVVMTFGSTRS